MARLEFLPPLERKLLEETKCPTFDTQPWVKGPPLNQRRVAIISTAGLHGRDDRPFTMARGDNYRIIPGDINASDLLISHLSTNFDRTGFQQDWNVIFPLDRFKNESGETSCRLRTTRPFFKTSRSFAVFLSSNKAPFE